MSDDRSATEVWLDWFAERGNVWYGVGDCGSGPHCECVAVIDCDDSTGERQAFLFRTFAPEGWFVVLDYNSLTTDDRTEIEWLSDVDGRLDAVVKLCDFVASLVPTLADTTCPGPLPSAELIARMEARERLHPALNGEPT